MSTALYSSPISLRAKGQGREPLIQASGFNGAVPGMGDEPEGDENAT